MADKRGNKHSTEYPTSLTISRMHFLSHVLIYLYRKVNGLEIVKSIRAGEKTEPIINARGSNDDD